jgi:hypothetical protein
VVLLGLGGGGALGPGDWRVRESVSILLGRGVSVGGFLGEVGHTLRNQGGSAGASGLCVGSVLGLLHGCNICCVSGLCGW